MSAAGAEPRPEGGGAARLRGGRHECNGTALLVNEADA
jgi:hypothetical protein